jgi:hypothetical protein
MFSRTFITSFLVIGAAIATFSVQSDAHSTALLVPLSAAELQGQAAPAARHLGTIKAIKGKIITLSTDEGADVEVVVGDSTRIIRVEPGQKDLKGATALPFKDLQIGDRILVRGQLFGDAKSFAATGIIAMKHEALEAKQQREREDWQKRGIGGLVSSVDPAAGTVTIGAGSVATTTIVVHSTKDTVIRRYAPDSVKFNDAKPSALDSIQAGDQLRARGTRSADGKDFAAEEIVSGAFRNIAGTIASIDAASNTINVLDAITKQSVVVKLLAESQVRKLPPEVAQGIAARFKAAASGAAATPGANAAPSPADQPQASPPPNATGAPPGGPRRGGASDLQQLLSHLPPATIADLQKGDAVMIVSTQGGASGQVTAITLLAGVEPILTASPRNAQAALLSPWSLGGGGDTGPGGDTSP